MFVENCSECYDGAARAQCSAEIADLLKIHKIEKTWMKHEEIRSNLLIRISEIFT